MRIYQCGGISHDPNANDWRVEMAEALPMHEFWNPLTEERAIGGRDLGTRFQRMKRFADSGSTLGLKALRRIMLEQIIPLDLDGVKWADVLICRVKRDVRLWGSVCEIYEAKIIQGKPVCLITDLKYIEMNAWEIALADEIWFSMDEAVEALKEVSDIGDIGIT
jgi:hypothetical protein